jgi:hypothetical protein
LRKVRLIADHLAVAVHQIRPRFDPGADPVRAPARVKRPAHVHMYIDVFETRRALDLHRALRIVAFTVAKKVGASEHVMPLSALVRL